MTNLPTTDLVGGLNPYVINNNSIGAGYTDLGAISTVQILCAEYLGNGIVLVGNKSSHIFRSSDYGTTWTDLGIIGAFSVQSLVYLGNGIVLCITNGVDIYRSTDFGISWTGVAFNPIFAFGASFNNLTYLGNGVVLAGDSGGNILRSSDYGLNWSSIAGNPIAGILNQVFSITHLDLSSFAGGTIFTAIDGKMWRSIDTGLTWTLLGNITGFGITSAVYMGRGMVIAGDDTGQITTSSDYGLTWKLTGDTVGAFPFGIQKLEYMGNGIVAAGAANGHIYTSRNFGKKGSWLSDTNLSASAINDIKYLSNGITIAVDDNIGGHIYRHDISYKTDETRATAHNDLLARNQTGVSAHNSQLVGVRNAYSMNASDVGVNWIDLGVITASAITSMCTIGNGISLAFCLNGNIYRCSDYGTTWLSLSGITGSQINTSTYLGNGIVIVGCNNGHEWRSTDFGLTWSDIGDISTDAKPIWGLSYLGFGYVISVTNGAATSGRIRQSIDYGLTWASVVTTATYSYFCSVYLENFISLVGDGIGHVWRSTNFGTNWTDLGQITTVGNIIRMCYLGNGICLFGVTNQHIWRSTDYGLTWTDLGVVPLGSPYDISYCGNGIVIIPDASGTIFRSADYGLTWTNLLYAFGLMKSSISMDNGICLAGDTNTHIFRSDVANKTEEHSVAKLESIDTGYYRRFFQWEGTVIQGTWAWVNNVNQTNYSTLRAEAAGFFINSVGTAIGDEYHWTGLYLGKGAYTLRIVYSKDIDYGLLSLSLTVGGTSYILPIEQYAAAPTYNQIVTSGVINVQKSGIASVDIFVGSKNVASTNFKINFSRLEIEKTG